MKKIIILCSSIALVAILTLSIVIFNFHHEEVNFSENERKNELYDILLSSFDHSNPECKWETVGYLPTIDYLTFLHETGLMNDETFAYEMNSLGNCSETDNLNTSEIESPVQKCVIK